MLLLDVDEEEGAVSKGLETDLPRAPPVLEGGVDIDSVTETLYNRADHLLLNGSQHTGELSLVGHPHHSARRLFEILHQLSCHVRLTVRHHLRVLLLHPQHRFQLPHYPLRSLRIQELCHVAEHEHGRRRVARLLRGRHHEVAMLVEEAHALAEPGQVLGGGQVPEGLAPDGGERGLEDPILLSVLSMCGGIVESVVCTGNHFEMVQRTKCLSARGDGRAAVGCAPARVSQRCL
mmetsp:Transcript_8969/g.37014  ORF Transcript_8969/g.37014 Transcript_8969/m.37014 type:complete len:234 (-) Transcript_8969:85-786(-)